MKTMCYRFFFLVLLLGRNEVYSERIFRHGHIVYPELFRSRGEKEVKVLRIADSLQVNLEKSSVLEKNFFVRTYRAGVIPHNEFFDTDVLEEDLYHDSTLGASLLVSERDNLEVVGLVSSNMSISPLRSTERSSNGRIPHMNKYVNDDDTYSHLSLYGGINLGPDAKLTPRYNGAYKKIAKKIYPEILVLCDSEFRSQFLSERQLIRYILISLNAVNLRYLTVTDPEVELRLRAIEILTAEKEEFIKPSKQYPGVIDGFLSLSALRHFVFVGGFTYAAYDIVYAITGLDIADVRGNYVRRTVMGYGYVAAACGMFRVALGEDAGETYKGVRVMAHELGHVLGCPHDGQTAYGYAKYTPDSRSCSFYDGYLMSHQEKDSRSKKFSRCCNRQISIFARTREALCLMYQSSVTQIKQVNQTALLPGEVANRNQQCLNAYPTLKKTYWIKNMGEQNCTIHCFAPKDDVFDEDMEWPTFLTDGSKCGDGNARVCINGDCTERRAKYAAKPV